MVGVKKNLKKPFIFTIFGASGDLAKLKIFPALYELAAQHRFPNEFFIVGYARTSKSREAFQNEFTKAVEAHSKIVLDKEILAHLVQRVYYFSGQYTELPDFEAYHDFLKRITGVKKKKLPVHVAYFSVPSKVFKPIVRNLALSKKSKANGCDIRLVIEKPFGEDRASAEEMFHFVSQYFSEDCFYLLDHYLGKSSVRSLLQLRRRNRILFTMMHGREVANIQITKFEDFGVKDRVGYFDNVGIIKDMIQSHLLQIMALITMDIPVTESASGLQREKHGVLSAVTCLPSHDNVVIGQYAGYKKEKGVPKGSKTETFAAVRLLLDRQQWYDVPMYMRTGKKMHESHGYIVVELKKFDFQSEEEEPNRLIFELTPEERLNIALLNRQEDVDVYQEVTTSESFACSVEGCLPEHAVLLLDVLCGDKFHFLSFEEVVAGWRVVDQIEKLVESNHIKLEKYADGSEGPKSQHKLTGMDGFVWYDLDHPAQGGSA
jgi:glucose-6-phosphate 1-dehydrogenase